MGFSGGSDGKESTCKAGELDLIPGLERSPRGGHGNPFQYSCLENPLGQRCLVAYSLWGHRRVGHDSATEHTHTHKFSSVAQSCPTLCNHRDCSVPGFPVHHQHPEFAQTHVHYVGNAIQPSHPLSSPSPPAFSLSQNQGLLQWVSSSHQVAKVLGFQLQHQSFQWIFKTDFS